MGILFYYHGREKRRHREERQRVAEELWNEHVQRLELPPSWVEVAETLARYLRDPVDRYLLFENQHSFNAAAQAALADDAVREGTVSALRVRLGYSVSPEGSPLSTASLSQGTEVFVRSRTHREPVRATVRAPDPHHLQLQLHEPERHFRRGSAVELYYRNARGVFRILTDVLGQEEQVLSLRHTERVSREQKRRFFRKRLSVPIRVSYDSEEAERHPTRVRDLGGGGASFVNPDGLFALGDLVRLQLTARDGARLELHAKVLRLSENGNVCHVEFYSIRESMRDRIYNLLFAPPAKDAANASADETTGRP
jgi:hypothetical protein